VRFDELRNRWRHIIARKISAAPDLMRDILRHISRPLFGGVECDDANRVAVLAGHQIADEGFEVGLINVSKIVDDEIKGLIVTARHNRRNKAPAHKKLQTQRLPGGLHETEASEPQSITADRRTRTMSEIRVPNRTCGGYGRIDANDPQATFWPKKHLVIIELPKG
jgi:hypothetical protein